MNDYEIVAKVSANYQITVKVKVPADRHKWRKVWEARLKERLKVLEGMPALEARELAREICTDWADEVWRALRLERLERSHETVQEEADRLTDCD